MHEFHIVNDIFADLISLGKEKNASKITRVFLKLGGFSEINEDVLQFYFKENSSGTLLEGADIQIEKSPNRELRLESFDFE